MATAGGKFSLVCVLGVVFCGGLGQLLAHSVVGIRDRDVHRALVQSPSAATDMPVSIFNTGLSVSCFRVTNQSTTDANITAFGLEIPGVPDEVDGFALVWPLDRGWTIQEDVRVPGVADVTLDFAVVSGGNFTGGHRRLGIPAGEAGPTRICVSGPFHVPPQAPQAIETLLNGVFLGFKGGEGAGNVLDIGVWVNRL